MTGGDLPKPPAHLEPYVRVLGHDGAVEFLLEFGGAELYLSRSPSGRSRLARRFGKRKAAELAAAAELLPARVPTGKPFIARVLRARGLPVAEIARRLHVSDVQVRKYLSGSGEKGGSGCGRSEDPRQKSLF